VRLRRYLASAGVVATALFACGGVAAAQTTTSTSSPSISPVVHVSPTSVSAGDPFQVSGHCAAGWTALLYAELDTAGDRNDGRFSGIGGVQVAADGSFSTSVAILVEAEDGPWRLSVRCDHSVGDTLTFQWASTTLIVTGGTAEPLAFSAEPNAVLPGRDLNVSGSGCAANGHPLDGVSVSLGLDNPPRSYDRGALFTDQPVSPDGTWHATLAVPADYPPGSNHLYVFCSGGPARADVFEWSRELITVFPAPPSATTTTIAATTTTATTTTTIAVPVTEATAPRPVSDPPTLPRTGSNQTALLAIAILSLALGAAATRARSSARFPGRRI
jgi:LPXTG-motif cell wall-anchored protein